MSTTTIATTSVGGHAGARDTARPMSGKGFPRRLYQALVASRQAEANRLIAKYLATLSEQDRKDLGFPSGGDAGRR